MGLVSAHDRTAVLAALVEDIRRRGNAFTVGDIGGHYVLRALADGHRSDVIFDVTHNTTVPGYGYQLMKGATSLTETWDANPRFSQNHFMLGHIMEWFYRDLAGIGVDEDAPSFQSIVIRPQPVGDIQWVKASYDSVRGRIASDWTHSNGKFELNIDIPANSTAKVHLPSDPEAITDVKSNPAGRTGAILLQRQRDRVIYQVPSGRWTFHSSR